MNYSHGYSRARLRSLLQVQQLMMQRQALASPEGFRRLLWLPEANNLYGATAQTWQLADVRALDNAWLELAGRRPQHDSTTVRRAYIERPRGHSKTTDMAVQIAWILLAARRPVAGLAAAADRDQANFLHDSLKRLAARNQLLFEKLLFQRHRVRNRDTGSRLDVISSDARSSYGALPDFVVCDELSHWPKAELWHSLLSSAAKKPHCVLTVLTNAGFGRGWQWDVREHSRRSPQWYFHSLKGSQAPWITREWLVEQQALLPASVFNRLWLNEWQHSEGDFLQFDEVNACIDSTLTAQATGRPEHDYVAAIDYAEKRDLTVGCVCHREGELIFVDRMDVVRPTPQQPTPIQWVEDWIERIARTFKTVRFVVDEYQLLGTIQRWEQSLVIERFAFASGRGNHQLALALRRLILEKKLRWPEGCGAIPGDSRDDLATELAGLILKQSANGRLRIDHVADGRQHDDRSFALGVACLALLEEPPAGFCQIDDPGPAGAFWLP